jgi:hypothetical protein
VKFNIINQTKYPHFYKEGMKPAVFSELDHERMYTSWTFRTENVMLNKIPILNTHAPYTRTIKIGKFSDIAEKQQASKARPYHFILSFTHTFKNDNDRVFFAFYKPHSFTRMLSFNRRTESQLTKLKVEHTMIVNKLTRNKGPLPEKEKICNGTDEFVIEVNDIYYKRERLCLTLGHIPVDIITITSNQETDIEKTYIIITARVHAAETAGSFKVQGVINFLLSKNSFAIDLRNHHIFIIVPMLNPDGVILGNNRCSLAGYDLNRCWGAPNRRVQPSVYKLKSLLTNLCFIQKKKILVFCDLHGHSKLLNSFVYACHEESIGTLCSWTQVRLLPRLLAKKTHLVNYHQCSFRVESDKVIIFNVKI